jgi:outer membrane receptor for ferrienterochelin and colicins
MFESNPFSEFSIKLSYEIDLKGLNSKIEFYLGLKNITNAYQSQFDIGKNRDSNFVFGPAQPRTLFFGVKFRN